MKLRHLFTINIFIAVFFGLACAVFPEWTIQLYGLDATMRPSGPPAWPGARSWPSPP